MKKILVLLFVLSLSTVAVAQDKVKIGFVNLQQALNESVLGKQSKAQLEGLIKERQAKIDEKIKEKEKLEAEFQRQQSILSDEAARVRMDEMERMERDIERMVSDSNSEVQKLQRQKEVSIIKDLDDIITRLGAEQGYTIILPADVVLYSADGVELTGEVIRRYDEVWKNRTGGAAPEGDAGKKTGTKNDAESPKENTESPTK